MNVTDLVHCPFASSLSAAAVSHAILSLSFPTIAVPVRTKGLCLNMKQKSSALRELVLQIQVLTFIYHSHIGQSPRYLRDLIRLPSSSSAKPSWPSWSLCPTSEDFCGSDMSLCNYWPCTLEPTPSFDMTHLINWWAKCLFSFSQDCSLLSGSLTLEALLIGVHWEMRYINVQIQYNTAVILFFQLDRPLCFLSTSCLKISSLFSREGATLWVLVGRTSLHFFLCVDVMSLLSNKHWMCSGIYQWEVGGTISQYCKTDGRTDGWCWCAIWTWIGVVIDFG